MTTTDSKTPVDPNYHEYPKLLFNQETGQEITVQSKEDEQEHSGYGPTPPAPKHAEASTHEASAPHLKTEAHDSSKSRK